MERSREVESIISLCTDDFALREIDLAAIDIPRSRRSQNRRTETLDQDHVLRIASSIDLGVSIPPLVVLEAGQGFWIIDGNHRQAALQLLDKPTAWAYVVRADDDTYAQLCLIFNLFNGKPLSEADRVANALASMDLGMPATTVAKFSGIDHKRLLFLARERDGRRKVAEAGVRMPKGVRLGQGHAEVLNRLEPAHIKRLGVEAVLATKGDLEESVRAINAAPSAERDGEALRQSVALEMRRQQRLAPKAKVRGAMTSRTARTRLKEVLIAVRTNVALLSDPQLVALIRELGEVSNGAGRKSA